MTLGGHRVWILGYGFLGQVLADKCRAAGADVLSIDRSSATGADLCADSTAPATIAQAIEMSGGTPSVIFCCLSTRGGSVEDYRHCYLQTVQNLEAAHLLENCIFCSSSSIYGAANERTAVLAECEQRILSFGGCVARLVPLYGPGRCELLRRHIAREPKLAGPPERVLNYVHVEDAASALMLLAEREVSGYCDVCGESFTKSQIYAELERVTGIPASQTESLPGRRSYTSASISADTLRALGWVPEHRLINMVQGMVPDRE